MDTKLRAAIYCRISDDSEGKALGVQRQEEDCRDKVEAEGWDLVEAFIENDRSASTRSTKPRPEFERMLEEARAGHFAVIVAYSSSRLTRRPSEMEKLIELAERHGIRIVTLASGEDDLTTADGRMIARVKAGVDAAEAERTAERVARTQRQRRESGFLGTRRAFGWDIARDPSGKRVPDTAHPDEFEALQTGIRMIIDGESVRAVCRLWNDQGLTTTTGRAWDPSRCAEALTRWRNAGIIEHKGEPIRAALWPQACTPDELETVRARLASRHTRRGPVPTYLASGIATCGRCSRPMFAGKGRTQLKDGAHWFRVYRCSGSRDQTGNACFVAIKQEILDGFLIKAVRELLWFSDHHALAPSAAEKEHVRTLADERDSIAATERRIGEMVGSGEMSLDTALPALAGRRERRQAIDRELAIIAGRFPLQHAISSANLFERAADLQTAFDSLDMDKRREIVRALMTVEVGPGRDNTERVVIRCQKTERRISNTWNDNDEFEAADTSS